ncbi:MAG: hypothetical protein K0R76_259 [Alphaproteobacteria bacterium]|jgi:hypothetical protein|nr:hypothetical protein [Alphaproteobacteria bacterium]
MSSQQAVSGLPNKTHKNKKIFMGILLLVFLGMGSPFYKDAFINFYFRLTPFFQEGYAQDKALVLPYFDEVFYRRTYAAELEKSGQDPLDHFMQRSGRLGGGDFDPNPWFNVTLYKEHLWPCFGNAFVDFLRQPSLKVPENAGSVEIYANPAQFYRAWMAVEGFLRLHKFKVLLVLPESFENTIPACFQPMIKRGLAVQFSKDSRLSFYKSPFLKSPDAYGVTDLPAVETAPPDVPITRFRRRPGYEYLMHRLYKYTQWQQKGRINPCMLNFAHYCFEPIEFSNFGHNEPEFKKNMQRLAPGFDLMFINSDIGTKNLRIVPGFMFFYITPDEIPAEKKYEVSFLLSLGGKGMDFFKSRGSFIYHFRKAIWEKEPEFTLLTKFYVSRRDIDKYPETLKKRVLPTDSKKWIFGSQFTIAIENSRQAYYFSEKLLGCFMALSVPIYIGCPNIGEYFDTRGMLIAKDPEDVLRIVRTLTPDTYKKMLPYLEENKRRAEKLVNLEDHYIDEFSQMEMTD